MTFGLRTSGELTEFPYDQGLTDLPASTSPVSSEGLSLHSSFESSDESGNELPIHSISFGELQSIIPSISWQWFEHQDLNSKQRKDYARLVRTIEEGSSVRGAYSEDDQAILEQLNHSFYQSFLKAVPEAIELNKVFREICTFQETDLSIDAQSGVIHCSFAMFSVANSIARKKFAGLVSLVHTEEQEAYVFRLILTIMIGDPELSPQHDMGYNVLFKSFCFNDLRDFSSFSRDLEEGGASVDTLLANSFSSGNNSFYDKSLSALRTASDVITNYERGDPTVKISFAQSSYQDAQEALLGFGQIMEILAAKFKFYLLNHPESLPMLFEQTKNSQLYKEIKKRYAESFPGNSEDMPNIFSETIFNWFLDISQISGWKDIVKALTSDESQLKQLFLAGKKRVTRVEIQSVLRLKLLEVLITIGCLNETIVTQEDNQMLSAYRKPLGTKTKKIPIHAKCVRSNCRIDLETWRIHLETESEISLDPYLYVSLRHGERLGKRPVIGSTASEYQYPLIQGSVKSVLNSSRIFLMKELKFNWRAPENVLSFFVSQINPPILETLPSASLQKEVENIRQIANLERNDALIIDFTGLKFQKKSPPSLWDFVPGSSWISGSSEGANDFEELSEEETLAKISSYLEYFRGHLERYLKFIRYGAVDQDLCVQNLAEVHQTILKVKSGLIELSATYTDRGKNLLDSFSAIYKLIDNRIIAILPKIEERYSKGDQRSWPEAIYNTFVSSNEPEDIGWKIERYRSILMQLKSGCDKLVSKIFGGETPESFLEKIPLVGDYSLSIRNCLSAVIDGSSSPNKQVPYTREILDSFRSTLTDGFITNLRQAAQEKNDAQKNGEEVDLSYILLLEGLGKFFYTGINLEEQHSNSVKNFDRWGQGLVRDELPLIIDESYNPSLTHPFEKIHKHMAQAPAGPKAPIQDRLTKSLKDRYGFLDSNMESNPAHAVFELDIVSGTKTKKVTALAFGSPTKEVFSKTELVPEFVLFQEALEREKKKYLYIINQSMIPVDESMIPVGKLKGGDETKRVDAILGLADKERFKKTFYAWVFSMDSDFYFQKGEFVNPKYQNPEIFMQALYDEHFVVPGKISGNHASPNIMIQIPDIREFGKEIAKIIYEELFDHHEILTVEERQNFIDKFRDALVMVTIYELEIDFFSCVCKDGIDRAIGFIARLWAHFGIVNDVERTEKFVSRLTALVFSRAMTVRKRAIILKRLKRLVQGILFMERNKEELKAADRRILRHRVKPDNGQSPDVGYYLVPRNVEQ